MNVSQPREGHQPPAACDRVAFYASKSDPARTMQQPIRAWEPIPARVTHRGAEWVLLSFVGVQPGESVDEAIARETADLRDLIAEIEADARAAEVVS